MQAALVKLSGSTHIRKRWRPDGRKGSVGKGESRKRNGDENSPNDYRYLWNCQRKSKLKDKHMSFSLYSLHAVVASESPAPALSSDQDPFLSHAHSKVCWWGTSCSTSFRDVGSQRLCHLVICSLKTDNLHTARKHRGDLIASHPVPASCLFDFSTLAGVCHMISTQLQEKLAVWLPQPQKKVRSETWQCSNGAWEK